MKNSLPIIFVFLSSVLFSQSYLAQNTSPTWRGLTPSTVTYSFTGSATQVGNSNIRSTTPTNRNFLIHTFHSTDLRLVKSGEMSYTISFSPSVPANEIAFCILDLDAAVIIPPSSPTTTYTFTISGTATSNDFSDVPASGVPNPLTYNPSTGVATSAGAIADQYLLLVGSGSNLVSSITVTSLGVSSSDLVAYSFFANQFVTLPIKLDYFNATTVNCENIISWKTNYENDLQYFELQSSNDGINFKTIKNISSSNFASTYKYVDKSSSDNSKTYYRLKTIDNSGQFEYSNITTTQNCINKNNVLVNYNNNTNQITVNCSDVDCEINLYDINGQLILKKKKQNKIEKISLLNYSKQLYILSVIDRFGNKIYTQKIGL